MRAIIVFAFLLSACGSGSSGFSGGGTQAGGASKPESGKPQAAEANPVHEAQESEADALDESPEESTPLVETKPAQKPDRQQKWARCEESLTRLGQLVGRPVTLDQTTFISGTSLGNACVLSLVGGDLGQTVESPCECQSWWMENARVVGNN